MKRFLYDPFVWLLAAIIIYGGYEGFVRFVQPSPLEKLKQADAAYREGEKTQNAFQRKDAFNKSLDIYTNLENKYDPEFGNGKLYFNIANNYYQLEEYPWAILYYYRAQALRPRDDHVSSNLAIAQSKLGIQASVQESPFKNIFFFHNYLSIPESLQVLFALVLLATAALAFSIWVDQRWLMGIFWVLGICCIFLLLSLSYSYYISPIEAVVVRSSALYRDAGKEYAKVSDKPLPAGAKVKVLEQEQLGRWLKVMSSDGSVGYLPNDALRII